MNENKWRTCIQCISIAVPAEVQQRACGGGYSLCWPAQEVELSEGTSFLGLDVLQVETTHEEVITPDVFRHQVHLSMITEGYINAMTKQTNHNTFSHKPHICGREKSLHRASSDHTASLHPQLEQSSSL